MSVRLFVNANHTCDAMRFFFMKDYCWSLLWRYFLASWRNRG